MYDNVEWEINVKWEIFLKEHKIKIYEAKGSNKISATKNEENEAK